MTGAELGVLGAIFLALVGLLIKAFIPNKKASNPGNPGNSKEEAVDRALMLASQKRVEQAIKDGFEGVEQAMKDGFGRIEDKLP